MRLKPKIFILIFLNLVDMAQNDFFARSHSVYKMCVFVNPKYKQMRADKCNDNQPNVILCYYGFNKFLLTHFVCFVCFLVCLCLNKFSYSMDATHIDTKFLCECCNVVVILRFVYIENNVYNRNRTTDFKLYYRKLTRFSTYYYIFATKCNSIPFMNVTTA